MSVGLPPDFLPDFVDEVSRSLVAVSVCWGEYLCSPSTAAAILQARGL
jgi:hypothetical protein